MSGANRPHRGAQETAAMGGPTRLPGRGLALCSRGASSTEYLLLAGLIALLALAAVKLFGSSTRRSAECLASVVFRLDSAGLACGDEAAAGVVFSRGTAGAERADAPGDATGGAWGTVAGALRTAGACIDGSCLGGDKCFVAGTPVWTAQGLRPIESVRAGDLVLSRDPETRALELRPVVRTFVTLDREVVRVELRTTEGAVEEIGATPNHPFWIHGRGWVRAGDLAAGDRSLDARGGPLEVLAVARAGQRATVHNFEVEASHSYFAGRSSAWVHNDCDASPVARDEKGVKKVSYPDGSSIEVLDYSIGGIVVHYKETGPRVGEKPGKVTYHRMRGGQRWFSGPSQDKTTTPAGWSGVLEIDQTTGEANQRLLDADGERREERTRFVDGRVQVLDIESGATFFVRPSGTIDSVATRGGPQRVPSGTFAMERLNPERDPQIFRAAALAFSDDYDRDAAVRALSVDEAKKLRDAIAKYDQSPRRYGGIYQRVLDRLDAAAKGKQPAAWDRAKPFEYESPAGYSVTVEPLHTGSTPRVKVTVRSGNAVSERTYEVADAALAPRVTFRPGGGMSIDLHGDGKYTANLSIVDVRSRSLSGWDKHVSITLKTPKYREGLYDNGPKLGGRTDGYGTDEPKAPAPSRSAPGIDTGYGLPAEVAVALAESRLAALLEARKKAGGPSVPWTPLVEKLAADRKALAGKGGTDQQSRRAARLGAVLVKAERAYAGLDVLNDEKQYLPDVAKDVLAEVKAVRDRYDLAVYGAYSSDPDVAAELAADADRAAEALPHRVSRLYLNGATGRGKGIEAMIDQIAEIERTTREAALAVRELEKHTKWEKFHESPLLIHLGTRRLGELREEVKRARDAAAEGRGDPEAVLKLTAEIRLTLRKVALLATYEQSRILVFQLDSVVDEALDAQRPKAVELRDNLRKWVKRLEKDPKDLKALEEFEKVVGAPDFKDTLDKFQERAKTIAVTRVIGKVIVIVAVSAFAAHLAAEAVGGYLLASGYSATAAYAGAFGTEVIVFTAASRAGHELVLGGNETPWYEDLATNTVMFGVLKGASAAYGAVFRIGKEASALQKAVWVTGQKSTAFIALTGFSEMHHLVGHGLKKGEWRFMTREERYRAYLQNVLMFAGLEVGQYLAKPLAVRLKGKINEAFWKRYQTTLEKIEADRTEITELIKKDPANAANLFERMQALWNQEVALLERAMKDGVIKDQVALDDALRSHHERAKLLELQMAQLGVDAAVGPVRAFRVAEPGTIVFADAELQFLKDYYAEKKGTLEPAKDGGGKEIEGAWTGRIGKETFQYVAESRAPAPTTVVPRRTTPEVVPRPASSAVDKAVDAALEKSGLEGQQHRPALERAHDVAYQNLAPFVVEVARKMLVDLKASVEKNPKARVVFVGRDGHSLAIAIEALDPTFFKAHCSEVVLSRATVEAAMQDAEAAGATFPGIEGFRGAKGKADPASIPGAKQNLSDYLARNKIPLTSGEVILVDTSFKGTVQELLAALYPKVSYQGRYVFFGQEPTDPHPGTKKGYVINLPDQAYPDTTLSPDAARTFAHQEAIGIIEETLHGPMASPTGIGKQGPSQVRQSADAGLLDGLNPTRVSEAFRDPKVREAVKHLNHAAIRAYAERIAALERRGVDVDAELANATKTFRDQVRRWIEGRPVDPAFKEVMDSFVRRIDKKLVEQLDEALRKAGFEGDRALDVWRRYDELPWSERKAFVEDFLRRNPGK